MLVFAATLGAAQAEDATPSVKVPLRDPAMATAFAKAASTLDEFLVKWRDPPAGSKYFTVKIGIQDTATPPGYSLVLPGAGEGDDKIEWFWTAGLSEEGSGFSALLSNEPETVHNVKNGQMIHFERRHIGDWMYVQNGKIVGNATACPALAHASAAERKDAMDGYGLNCE